MALTVANNVSALTAQLNLNRTSSTLASSLEKLSTGLKINRGADGPAALVISEQQRAQIAGLQTALTNTSKAIALVQTGEGALNEVNSLLTKARSLALDSANTGVNDQNALDANQAELSNILSTIDSIATRTQFGQKKLLDGSAGLNVTTAPPGFVITGNASVVSGTYTPTTSTAASKAHVEGTAAAFNGTGAAQGGTITINGVSITIGVSQSQAQVLNTINSQSSLTGVTAQVGAGGNQFQLVSNSFGSPGTKEIAVSVSSTAADGLAIALGFGTDGTISSADSGAAKTTGAGTAAVAVDAVLTVAGSTNTVSGNVVTFNSGSLNGLVVTLNAAGSSGNNLINSVASTLPITVVNNSLTFQTGANAGQTASVSFVDAQSTNLGKNASGVVGTFTSLSTINVNTTVANMQDALRIIDKAINDVTNARGTLGAFQANTLESNANNLQTTLQNTTAAESVIRDTDFAAEIAKFTRTQVQLQAGTSVLGNANQIPQLVSSLLQRI